LSSGCVSGVVPPAYESRSLVRVPLSFVAAAVGYFWPLPWAAGRRLGGASQGVTPWGMEHVGRPTVFLGGRSSTSPTSKTDLPP